MLELGTLTLEDEQATLYLGERLARLQDDLGLDLFTVYLDGDLGMGKTTLVRGLLRSLGHEGAVKSPTYTLVEHYALSALDVYHFDIYRLADAEELEYMGIRDFFEPSAGRRALVLVEWPERGDGVLPQPDLVLQLSVDGAGRSVKLSAKASCAEPLKRVLALS